MVIKKHISTLESLNFHFLLDESLLEPYVSKGTRTVLRRGKESNFSPYPTFMLNAECPELATSD